MAEATPTPQPNETTPNPDADLPDFHSQVKKEWKEAHRDEMKALKGKTVQDVLESHFKLQKTINERGLIIPTKDSSEEEVQAFHDKMGLPRKAEDYKLAADEKVLSKDIVEEARKFVASNGYTQKQAQAYVSQLEAIAKAGQGAVEARKAAGEANVVPALTKELNGDAKAVEATLNLAKKYLSNTHSPAVRQKLIDTGVLYDPTFLKEAAAAQAKAEPHARVDGQSSLPEAAKVAHGKMGNYHKDWVEQFGKKAAGG